MSCNFSKANHWDVSRANLHTQTLGCYLDKARFALFYNNIMIFIYIEI